MDTLQLVNHKIRVYTMRKGISDTVIYDAKAVRAVTACRRNKWWITRPCAATRATIFPGVKGIGEKTAGDLIKKFGSFENLYKQIKYPNAERLNLKPRILKLLLDQEEQAIMSHQLSKIDCAVPMEFYAPQYDLDAGHLQTVVKLFQELEFRSLINKLPKTEGNFQN